MFIIMTKSIPLRQKFSGIEDYPKFIPLQNKTLMQLSGLPPLMVLQLLSDSAFVKVAGICTGLLMEK